MLVVNTDIIPGYDIVAVHGLVQGNTVRMRHVSRNLAANFKSAVSGEVTSQTEMLAEARTEALNRLIKAAESKGANAIVNVRFTSSAITPSVAEVHAYGTAVSVNMNGSSGL